MMNAYLLDFYIHGQVLTLALANDIRSGDIWYLLQDFSLTLLTVKIALQELLLKASKNKVGEGTVEMENDNEDGNHELYDAAEGDDDYIQKSDFDRPAMMEGADLRIIVSAPLRLPMNLMGNLKRCVHSLQ